MTATSNNVVEIIEFTDPVIVVTVQTEETLPTWRRRWGSPQRPDRPAARSGGRGTEQSARFLEVEGWEGKARCRKERYSIEDR